MHIYSHKQWSTESREWTQVKGDAKEKKKKESLQSSKQYGILGILYVMKANARKAIESERYAHISNIKPQQQQ